MKQFPLLALLVIFLYVGPGDAFWWTGMGKCPETPLISNYTVNMTFGKWYEIMKVSNNLIELGAKCNMVNYIKPMDSAVEGAMDMTAMQTRQWFGSFETMESYSARLEPISALEPNKFNMTLTNVFGVIDMDVSGVFSVLYDDYENYKIVYNCQETDFVFFTAKTEQAWIFARNLTIDMMDINMVTNLLGQYTDVSKLTSTMQDCVKMEQSKP